MEVINLINPNRNLWRGWTVVTLMYSNKVVEPNEVTGPTKPREVDAQ